MATLVRLAGIAVFAGGLAACEPAAERPAEPPAQAAHWAGPVEHEAASFTVLASGTPIGAVQVTPQESGYAIFYEFRNNGRGPTFNEVVVLDGDGLPTHWAINGTTTFGNAVDEVFRLEDGAAFWRDTTGENEMDVAGPALYAPQNSSPYSLAITARALMAADGNRLAAIPGGEVRMEEMDRLTVSNGDETREITSWALSGLGLNPTYFLMDGEAFFGVISPSFAILAEGFEGEDERLRELAADYGASRFEAIQARVAHEFDGPVRVRNVRVFDPLSEALGEPVSVVVEGNRIAAIDPLDMPSRAGEVEIDGTGGSLLPGLFEMHAHMGEASAFLNIAAGVTSARDMGNNNEVLEGLIANIEAGRVAGPRLYRSAFIEGRSPFNSNSGVVVESEEEAVQAVHDYADRGGFHQIKIYNSMRPEWIPAVIAAARERGLRVTGHIPAFTNADAMIEAGYDEIVHINQLMLGWVLDADEDTRTLLRLTALQRLPVLDLDSPNVQATIDAMVERGVAIDPTFAIHEQLLLSRNGEVFAGAVDYVDHLPVNAQRGARSAMSAIGSPEEDEAYRGAFEQIRQMLAMMRERGIAMVPGTDLGGSFTYHRELELYQLIGMEPAEILGWASHGMAAFLGVENELGRIEPGYLADFFLVPGDPTQDLREIKTIAAVVADGRVYFPSEIYPEFGIRPFTDVPAMRVVE
ncbi:amidohydrolase family protein [Glycocaulis sp.]|uniref:amidohydrolase family protein n=1 Tax=Glycocaulis sp. TaxID=1969725 RepID=UPI003D1FFE89